MAEKLFYRRNVFLLSVGVDTYEISEPAKFDQVLIEVIWDDKLMGYRFEFSDSEVLLEFDRSCGYDLLRQAYQADKVNANASLHFGEYTDSETISIIYEAKLNFDSYQEDNIKIKLNCERRSFSDKFLNYYETKVDVKRTTSLNDTSLTFDQIEAVNLFLHPRLFTQIANMVYDDTIEVAQDFHLEPVGPGGEQVVYTVIPAFTLRNPEPDCSQATNTTETNIDGVNEALLAPDGIIISIDEFPEGITKRIFYIEARVSFSFDKSNASGTIYSGIYATRAVLSSDTSLIPLSNKDGVLATVETQGPDNEYIVVVQDHGNVAASHSVTHLVRGYIEVPVGYDRVFIKCFVRGASTDFPPLDGDSSSFSVSNFQFTNVDTHYLIVKETTTFPTSLVNAYYPHELLNRQLEIILDTTNPLRSSLLGRTDIGYASDGCAAHDLMLDGLSVRGFYCRPFNVSAKDIVEGLAALWGCGLSMERDNDGNEFVRFEQIEYFFRDSQVASFDFVSDYNKRPDLERTFNEVSFGFKKYPSDNEPESLEDWMTVMNYITPIIRYKNKFEKLIPLILSSYYIEYTRRESFKEKPTDTYETDNDLFVIRSGATSDFSGRIVIDQTTNTITLYGIFPVAKDDVVSITSSPVSYAGVTVTDVEIPFSYDRTIITVAETITVDQDENGTASLVTDNERMQAIRDEVFSFIEGVPFVESVYNLEHHIMRIVMRWVRYFTSGWSQYHPSQKIRFVSGVGNTKVGTILNDDSCGVEGAFDLGPSPAFEWEEDPLFSGNIIECKVDMDWSLFDNIRRAYENRHPTGLNYGYLSIKNPDGEYEHGFPRRMSFNPTTHKCTLVLLEKYS